MLAIAVILGACITNIDSCRLAYNNYSVYSHTHVHDSVEYVSKKVLVACLNHIELYV